MTWLLVFVLALAVVPLVLAAAGVGTVGWLVVYLAVLAVLAVAFRIGLRDGPKDRDRRSG